MRLTHGTDLKEHDAAEVAGGFYSSGLERKIDKWRQLEGTVVGTKALIRDRKSSCRERV